MDDTLANLNNQDPLSAMVAVVEYLNLCAEEYLWYKKGRIDAKVWEAWWAGMLEKFEDPSACRIAKQEMNSASDSYYGFLHALAPHLKC